MSSWTDLRAPFFERVCRSSFDASMAQHAFDIEESTDAHVVYAAGDRFLECSYYVEGSANYELTINVGFLRRSAGGRTEFDGVGLWRSFPEAEARHASSQWTFADEPSLRRLLAKLRAEAIESVALPILAEPGKLSAALDVQRRELEGAHAQGVELDRLARARRSYEAGRYDEAVRLYEQMHPLRMLASDSKKLELARRRVREGE